ncbi:MAG: alternative ribosome rescue aminoacyl-tRNA hydrolase ArfB [Thermodesulfobacteriota bacterium]|nr:alternative ribosome rescue aminoacyl-tRNA hydrolase ArfB [Thermodesulfobacteriota bacterium]
MIRVSSKIMLDDNELHFRFVRASGPGGQNVNKVATAVQLRFDVTGSPSLPPEIRERLVRIAGKKVTESGTLIIEARRFRTQERNRQDAIDRLAALIHRAAEIPKPRRKTMAPFASRRRRIEAKQRRSQTKRMRRPTQPSEE